MIDEELFEAEEKMDKAVAVAKEDFATIRTGRATPQMFSKVLVDYYGAPTPIQQLASFQTPEARMIVISPFDKSSMQNIERAIRDSDLGVNPVDDGNVIRVVLAHPHRGAAQGVHQAGATQGRGFASVDPQHPSAREGPPGEDDQGWRRR